MPKHILCADDSVTMQKVVSITFAHTDYQVTAARNVDEALSLARQNRPDLVLADAVMPGRTGYDLAQALKSDPAFQRVPVVILVGNSQPYDEARGKLVGADGFLSKPWDTQVFIEKVGEILTRAATQGVAQIGGPPRAASAPIPAPVSARPPFGGVPRPTPPVAPPAPRVPGPPPLAGRPSAPVSLPKPPAGLPRPPLIRGAPIGGRPGAAQPIVQPAARLADPRIARAVPPPAARPVGTPPPHQVTPPPATSPTRPGRQATIMGMPAVNMPPAAQPAPHPPPKGYGPPPPAPPLTPPAAARPLPGSDALARAAPRVAAAGMTATQQAAEARGLDPRGVEYEAIARLSREIIEQIAWEVVPELAEVIIREKLHELKK